MLSLPRRVASTIAFDATRFEAKKLSEAKHRISPRSMRLIQLVSFCVSLLFAQLAPAYYVTQPRQVPNDSEALEFFEKKIRPILANHCFECHSAKSKKLQASLMLDSRNRMLKGGDSGTALVPFQADESSLITAVRYESYEMPPKGKLPDTDIEDLSKWVSMGAPWPEEDEPSVDDSKSAFDLKSRRDSHWMWQPINNPPIPQVNNTQWPKQPLDHFILANLERADIAPATPIDRAGLIRRLSFDLLGLPPSIEEVSQFVNDTSDNAIESIVDKMLRSPRYGERWGRHWLDLVRYAESRGHEFDADTPNAYQYRDYVIRAFNADVPYDQFVREHIAGDLLPTPRLNPEKGFNESILGTGFWFMGEWVHSPVDIRKDESDRFDNMIDVMSKSFLGVTVSCARCHDHKFDAISSRDYYSLTGFLQSSDYRQVRFETIETEKRVANQLRETDRSFADQIVKQITKDWPNIRSELVAILNDGSATGPENKAPTKAPWQTEMIPALPQSTDSMRVVVDFSSKAHTDLNQDGSIFTTITFTQPPLAYLDAANSTSASWVSFGRTYNDPFWNGLVPKRETPINLRARTEAQPRPGRTLRTPTFEVKHGVVSVMLRGSGYVVACVDSHRLVEGPLHGETIQETRSDDKQFRWFSMNLSRYIGHKMQLEFTPIENAQIEIIGAVDSAAPPPAIESLSPQLNVPAPTQSPLETLDAVADSIRKGDWNAVSSTPHNTAAINWILSVARSRSENQTGGLAEIAKLQQSWTKARIALRETLPNQSAIAIAMIDGSSEDDHVLIRGNSSAPGPVTPRRFLEAIDGPDPLPIRTGSGRLELAERINAPSNPLATRAIVNRVWMHLLGRGIVPTPDDFGVLGQRPTHPELLDHLATYFLENGRSIKKLIKYIVLSQTYQMSGETSPHATETDPNNNLLHYIAPKRLEGEAIRDSLLAITGEIDLKMYGEPIPIHLTSFMDGRGRPGVNGPLDGAKRRSIYIAVRRNFLSPFMLTFDTPVPFSTMGRRNVSNVPAQALIMLNDPFVIERARAWAQKSLQISADSQEQRLQWMYQTAFARKASENELRIALNYVNSQATQRGIDANAIEVWSDLAHALINLKEFIYLR